MSGNFLRFVLLISFIIGAISISETVIRKANLIQQQQKQLLEIR